MQSFHLLLLSVFVIGWTCCYSSTIILSINCSEYVNNLEDAFHPYKLNGSERQLDYCTKCLCDETGKEAMCTTVECPELNCEKVIEEEGKCCKSCDISDQFLIPDELAVSYCVVDGKLYTDLSLVPSTNTSDPCEVCHCCGGKVLCKSIPETCPKPRCDSSQLIWDENRCCPKCPFDPMQHHKQAVTCKQNGFIYQEGDVWNPYYPKFGVVDCLNCTCKDGMMNCLRLPCPPVRDCTEDDPVEDVTLCCPKCNRSGIPNPAPSEPAPLPINPSNKSEGSGSGMEPPTKLIIELLSDPEDPCKELLHKVYESTDSQIDQVAIESIFTRSVDVYVWNTSASTSSPMQYKYYSSHEFAEQSTNLKFKYIGRTTTDHIRRLIGRFITRKRRKNLKFCQAKCAATVINILKPCSYQTRK